MPAGRFAGRLGGRVSAAPGYGAARLVAPVAPEPLGGLLAGVVVGGEGVVTVVVVVLDGAVTVVVGVVTVVF
jgi:hypothetical protein